MDHAHVDVLGVVGRDEDFILGSGLHLIVLAFGNGLKFSLGNVVFGDGLGHVLGGHRAVVQYGVLIVFEVLQEVKQFLWVELTELLNGKNVAL